MGVIRKALLVPLAAVAALLAVATFALCVLISEARLRAPTRHELVLAVIALAALGLSRLDARSTAARDAELRIVRESHEAAQTENRTLRDAKLEADRMAADSIAELQDSIESYAARASAAAAAGAETYEQIMDALPDTLLEVRHLVDRREEEHRSEVDALRAVIVSERRASGFLRGQLVAANQYIAGLEVEIGLANRRIDLLEAAKDPGLSTLESVSLGAGGYMVATELLGATVLEGLIVGGGTFLVVKGGSKLIGWLF